MVEEERKVQEEERKVGAEELKGQQQNHDVLWEMHGNQQQAFTQFKAEKLLLQQ